MQVQDVMTRSPACCSENAVLEEGTQMIAQYDCGEIPVVDA